MFNDIAMGKGQGFPLWYRTVEVGGLKTDIVIKKNYCAGVKVCTGDGCSYATNKRQRENKCLMHESAHLESSGKCNGVFVYVYPKDLTDSRRWLGFFSENNEGHNHPAPIHTKLGSQLEEMIADCVQKDPTKKPCDLARGYGLPCLPGAVSLAGASVSSLAHMRNKYLVDTESATSLNLVKKFDTLIKSQVDAADQRHQGTDTVERMNKLTSPYLRWWTADRDMFIAVFATPQMLHTFSLAAFVEADVTFPGCQVFKYLLNVVTFNNLTLKWQVVARALLSKMTTAAYQTAFENIVQIVRTEHPSFEAQDIALWVVDFSDAQAAALEETLKPSTNIRGCYVHYIRLCHKVAEKVCASTEENKVFMAIAKRIPQLEDADDVKVCFDVLCGKRKLSALPDSVQLTMEEKKQPCLGWEKAESWVDWWKRPRHTRMLCKSLKDVSDQVWEMAPGTTNAVEAKNKESKPNSSSMRGTLEHIYRCDRLSAYEVLAAEQGLSVAASGMVREKRRKSQRKWRAKRSVPHPNDTCDVGETDRETSKKRSCEMGKDQKGRKKPKTQVMSDKSLSQDLIGQRVMIDTVGRGGKSYGYKEATIVGIQDSSYKAQYTEWPSHFAFVSDIDDVILLDKHN